MIYFSQRKCWNGPNCRFLAENRCRFFHPQQHYNIVQNVQHHLSNHENIQSIYNPFLRNTSNNNNTILRQIIPNLTIEQSSNQVLQLIPDLQPNIDLYQLSLNNIFGPSYVYTNNQQINSNQFQLSELSKQKETDLSSDKKWFFDKNKHIIIQQNSLQKYDQCAICVSQYLQKQKVTQLFCKHNFHKECITQWFCLNNKCPLCKKDFRQHKQYATFDKYYQDRIENSEDEDQEDYLYHDDSDYQEEYDDWYENLEDQYGQLYTYYYYPEPEDYEIDMF